MNKANLYLKAISKRGALSETDKYRFLNVNVDDETAMFLFDSNNEMTEQPRQADQTEITIIFKGGYSFKGTVQQLKERLHQSEQLEIQSKISSIEKIRAINNWSGYHDEGFNLKIKTLADWEKLYDFSVLHDIGYMDWDGLYSHTDNTIEYNQLSTQIEKLLGYKIY